MNQKAIEHVAGLLNWISMEQIMRNAARGIDPSCTFESVHKELLMFGCLRSALEFLSKYDLDEFDVSDTVKQWVLLWSEEYAPKA